MSILTSQLLFLLPFFAGIGFCFTVSHEGVSPAGRYSVFMGCVLLHSAMTRVMVAL